MPPSPTLTNWTLDAAGAWSTAADWSNGLPTSSTDATVSPTGGTAPFVLTYTQTGTVSNTVRSLSGAAFATLDIASGLLAIANAANLGGTAASWAGSVIVGGGTLDAKTGWTVAGPLTLSLPATLEVEAGTLALNGGGTLAGLLDGGGTVLLGTGGVFTLGSPGNGLSLVSGTLTIAGDAVVAASFGGAGLLSLASTGTLNLNGNTVQTEFGNTPVGNLAGTITGPGTFYQSGASPSTLAAGGFTVTAGATFAVEGTVDANGSLTVTGGSDAVIDRGTYALQGDVGIVADATSTLDIEQQIEKDGGTGVSTLSAGLIVIDGNVNGVVAINTGTLVLAGASIHAENASFVGNGALVLAGTSITLSGVTLPSGSVELAAGSTTTLTLTNSLNTTGPLSLDGASGGLAAAVFNIGSAFVSLGGTTGLLAGAIAGTAGNQVKTTGSTTISGLTTSGSVNLVSGGVTTQTGTLTAAGTVSVAANSTYDLSGDVGIAADGALTVINNGLLAKTAGIGTSAFAGSFANSFSGTLDIATGTVALTGPASLAGTVEGAGALTVTNFVSLSWGDGNNAQGGLSVGTLAIASQGAAGLITLNNDLVYAGVFDLSAVGSATTLDGIGSYSAGGATLYLAGQGTIDGSAGGTVLFTQLPGFTIASGASFELAGVGLAGGVTLDSSGTLNADGGISLDSDGSATTSLLVNEATATFVLAGSGAAIGVGGGAGAVRNAGLMEKLSGSGTASIAAASFANTGTLLVAAGTLSIAANVTGSGTLSLAAGTSLLLGGGFAGLALLGGGNTLGIGAAASATGIIAGFDMTDTIDLTGAASASATLTVLNTASAALSLNGTSLLLTGNFTHLGVSAQSDGRGGTAVTLVNAAFGSLPAVEGFFTAVVASELDAAVAALVPASGSVNVPTVAGGGAVASIGGALNAIAVTAPGVGGAIALPGGFRAGYLLGAATALSDTSGAAVLIATAAGDSLSGAAGDTLFGGNAGATLTATTGAETLIGGTGANAFFLGASTAAVTSQGRDVITGSSGAETVNATGSALYFGTSGATTFNASGNGGDTIIGGGNGNTVQGGGGGQLIFGSSTLNYTGGTGAATIIGGGGGNTVTGGAGNLLLFASASLTYAGTGGAATIVGGGGPLNAYLGSGGGVVFGSPGGNDTLSSGSGVSILVGGGPGDLLVATGAANDTLIAGAGAETLYGAGSSGNLVLFGGPGSDVMVGGTGRNLFIAEPGNATMVGGGTGNDIIFSALPGTARVDVVTGFNVGTDAIGLFGYGAEPGADAAALASATSSGGNTLVSLSDGTTIVFTGAPTLSANNFF